MRKNTKDIHEIAMEVKELLENGETHSARKKATSVLERHPILDIDASDLQILAAPLLFSGTFDNSNPEIRESFRNLWEPSWDRRFTDDERRDHLWNLLWLAETLIKNGLYYAAAWLIEEERLVLMTYMGTPLRRLLDKYRATSGFEGHCEKIEGALHLVH